MKQIEKQRASHSVGSSFEWNRVCRMKIEYSQHAHNILILWWICVYVATFSVSVKRLFTNEYEHIQVQVPSSRVRQTEEQR